MGRTKAELEEARDRYLERLDRAKSALAKSRPVDAIQHALESCQYIKDMMQYERRYNDREFEGVEAIDIILENAPLLFHHESLNQLESLLATHRSIDKYASDDVAGEVAEAKTVMMEARSLWNLLERLGPIRQEDIPNHLGGDLRRWQSIAEGWERMGVIRRRVIGQSCRLVLSTNMNERAKAKCPECGAVAKAPKSRLLSEAQCPKCRKTVIFVLLDQASGPTGEA